MIEAIPINSDAQFEKFQQAEKLLREACAMSIDMEKFPKFKTGKIYIGNTQFLDMRTSKNWPKK